MNLFAECAKAWEVDSMGLVLYAVPIFSIISFAGAAFTVFTGILNPERMGVSKNVLRMFGIGEVLMAVGWVMVLLGLRAESSWPQSLAFLLTGMYLCNYLVSLAMFKNMFQVHKNHIAEEYKLRREMTKNGKITVTKMDEASVKARRKAAKAVWIAEGKKSKRNQAAMDIIMQMLKDRGLSD